MARPDVRCTTLRHDLEDRRAALPCGRGVRWDALRHGHAICQHWVINGKPQGSRWWTRTRRKYTIQLHPKSVDQRFWPCHQLNGLWGIVYLNIASNYPSNESWAWDSVLVILLHDPHKAVAETEEFDSFLYADEASVNIQTVTVQNKRIHLKCALEQKKWLSFRLSLTKLGLHLLRLIVFCKTLCIIILYQYLFNVIRNPKF